ncbi:MAG: hypothetical protein L6R42_010149 [Xanthoria sp. 1 TBL-2021]|nr:MAG: hypothetical protein L6R42_010149 [Xanthoria sp. 1 TBL-2021]
MLPGKSSSSYCVVPTPRRRDEGYRGILAGRPTPQTISASQTQASSVEPPTFHDRQSSSPLSVTVFFCSAGTFAEKVAVKLTDRLRDLAHGCMNLSVCPTNEPLNQLQTSAIRPGSIVLLVVSSTGQGEVPANGVRFTAMCDREAGKRLTSPQRSFRYAIYGNGDSRYAATYNGAAHIINQRLRQIGGLTLAGGLHQGDTAVATTALQALNSWWAKLRPAIQDLASDSPKLRRANSDDDFGKGPTIRTIDFQTEATSRHQVRFKQLRTDHYEARIANINPSYRERYQGTYLVTLDIGSRRYEDMGCIQVLPINSPPKVRRALRALGVSASATLCLNIPGTDDPSYSTFLTDYIDLESPFPNFEWLQTLAANTVSEDTLNSRASLDVLEHLHSSGHLPAETNPTTKICLALPPLHPRTYSIASSLSYSSTTPPKTTIRKPNNQLTILTKPFPTGRFSHTFLSSSLPPAPLRYRLLPSPPAEKLLTVPPSTPLIIIATGAGFAPVRCLLQRRIATSLASKTPNTKNNNQSISLFLGLKPADISLFSSILNEAGATPHLISQLCIVPSNSDGVRVYDRLLEEGTREKMREMVVERRAWVFVCTGIEAARGTRGVFESVLEGCGGVEGMGERWIEEVY